MMQKSLAVLQILKILRKYSNPTHPLTQMQIIDFLGRDYDIEIERKAVARHLQNLSASGYCIEQTAKGVYLEDELDFDDSELRLLIDSVLFSKHISEKYAKELIEKLQNLGSVSFRRINRAIYRAGQIQREQAAGLFYTIDLIGTAIDQGRRILFRYNEYHMDKKLHPVFDELAELSPYQLVAANGHYYVIGKFESTGKIESFRVEKITDAALSEQKQTDADGKKAFDLDHYLSEHPYLYAGEIAHVQLKMNVRLVGELIDAFGKNFSVLKEEKGVATILLQAGLADMLEWAKRFAEEVEVLSPQSLRNKLRKISFPTAGKYFRSQEDRYFRALEFYNKQEQSDRPERCLCFDGIDLSRREEYKRYTFCKKIALRDTHLSDMSFLRDFPEIEEADIERNPVSDLSVLKGRKELRNLILKDTQVTDLSFLEGTTGLLSFEWKGKPIENIAPLYSLFHLQTLRMDLENLKKIDLLRLKRSCPNVQIGFAEVNEDTMLDEITQRYQEKDLEIVFEVMRKFAVKKRSPSEILEQEDIQAALEYLKEHERFNVSDFQRSLQIGYPKARALIQWMRDAAYIVTQDEKTFVVLKNAAGSAIPLSVKSENKM